MDHNATEREISSFEELYTAISTLKNVEMLGNIWRIDSRTFVIQSVEFLRMRLSDQENEVLLEHMHFDTVFASGCFSYGEAYRYLADSLRRIVAREERIQVLTSGIGFVILCTMLFSALMMSVQAGILYAVFHVGTMGTPGRFACVTGAILLSALMSAVLSQNVIKAFAREPSERRMRLGSTMICYITGIALIAGSAYLLLSIWAFYETETPFYVYLALTGCFGMTLSIGMAIILVTAKHRKR